MELARILEHAAQQKRDFSICIFPFFLHIFPPSLVGSIGQLRDDDGENVGDFQGERLKLETRVFNR